MANMIKNGNVATLITEENIEEYRRDARRIGFYGDGIEIGNYIYADRCGYDSFFVTFKPTEEDKKANMFSAVASDCSGSMSGYINPFSSDLYSALREASC